MNVKALHPGAFMGTSLLRLGEVRIVEHLQVVEELLTECERRFRLAAVAT